MKVHRDPKDGELGLGADDGTVVTNGAFDGTYGLAIIYENGRVEQTMLPNFRIVVKDPESGQVRRIVSGQVPPRGEPLHIDTSDPNAAQADLLTDPNGFVNVDPRTPISLRFSQALP